MQGQLDALVAETVEDAESAVKPSSPWVVTARHFLANRLAVVGVIASLALLGLAMAIGVTFGALAGYVGKVVATIIMRLTDVMMSFPLILLLIALAVVLQPSIGTIVVVIAIGGWTGPARPIHGEGLSLKEKDFILAARALG